MSPQKPPPLKTIRIFYKPDSPQGQSIKPRAVIEVISCGRTPDCTLAKRRCLPLLVIPTCPSKLLWSVRLSRRSVYETGRPLGSTDISATLALAAYILSLFLLLLCFTQILPQWNTSCKSSSGRTCITWSWLSPIVLTQGSFHVDTLSKMTSLN